MSDLSHLTASDSTSLQRDPATARLSSMSPGEQGSLDLLSVLRERLEAGTSSPEAIFHAVADAARVLTGAHGTALALRTNGVVICRARSGGLAPDLGSTLNGDSGISAECLRTAKTLRCDDSETDARVEAGVCRVLGIRSIAVVPLRVPGETFGILEVFSSEAFAFNDELIHSLRELGAIAEVAWQRQSAVSPALPPVSYSATQISELRVALSGHKVEFAPKNGRHVWILAASVAMLALASSVVWWKWRPAPAETATIQSTVQTHNATPETGVASVPHVSTVKPSPGFSNSQHGGAPPHGLMQMAAKVEGTENTETSTDVAVATVAKPAPRALGNSKADEPGLRAASSTAVVEPPVVVLAADNQAGTLARISSSPATLPELGVRVSQGVTESAILRRVEPVYPREALFKKLGGSVKLEASIDENGAVRNVKVLKGDPLLANAAVNAVRQWRYSQCLLNGKPVAVVKDITVVFRAP